MPNNFSRKNFRQLEKKLYKHCAARTYPYCKNLQKHRCYKWWSVLLLHTFDSIRHIVRSIISHRVWEFGFTCNETSRARLWGRDFTWLSTLCPRRRKTISYSHSMRGFFFFFLCEWNLIMISSASAVWPQEDIHKWDTIILEDRQEDSRKIRGSISYHWV